MSLEQYRSQRDHILSMIEGNQECDPSLHQIVDSLNELIALLEDSSEPAADELCPVYETVQVSAGPGTSGNPSMLSDLDSDLASAEEELHQSLLHMQCRVPFQHNWGQMQYSNAMIQAVDSTPVKDDVEEVHVRVLFLQPTHRKMIPCQFFLDGKCRFKADQCHYSHGEVYPLSKLKPYQVPDYSNFSVGKTCLCKGSDEIWLRGIVCDISSGAEDGDNSVSVRLDKSSVVKVFDISEVVPEITEQDDIDESSPEDAEEDQEENEDRKSESDETEFAPHPAWSLPIHQVSGAFGGWETHTKGFASKLMAKMGFIVGHGLGSRPGGRVEPVTAEVLPKGRSLDFCMDLREGRCFQKVGEKRRRGGMKQRRRKLNLSKTRSSEKTDMFSIINSQMNQVKVNPDDFSKRKDVDEEHKAQKPCGSSVNPKQLNVEAFKLHDKISGLEKEISRLKNSLARNQNTDKSAAAVIRSKISQKESELSAVLSRQKVVEKEQHHQKSKKSLVMF